MRRGRPEIKTSRRRDRTNGPTPAIGPPRVPWRRVASLDAREAVAGDARDGEACGTARGRARARRARSDGVTGREFLA